MVSKKKDDSSAATIVAVEDYMTRRMLRLDSGKSILEVARKMAEEKVSSIAITDGRGQKIIGVLTERDLVKAMANELVPIEVTAKSLMSHPVISISIDSSMEETARLMMEKQVRHLLVEGYDGGIVGIVSATDIARYLKEKLSALKEKDQEYAMLIDSEVWQLFI
jgi:predicted transcriptional regulator